MAAHQRLRRSAWTEPELGLVLGRLSLFGELNERQVEAGRHFARIVARFEREAGYQKRSPAGQQYNAGYGLKLTASNEMDLKAHESLRRSQRQFDNLERALYDPHTRAVVEEVCCNDREVGSLEIPTLRIGLTALADHLKFPG